MIDACAACAWSCGIGHVAPTYWSICNRVECRCPPSELVRGTKSANHIRVACKAWTYHLGAIMMPDEQVTVTFSFTSCLRLIDLIPFTI